MKKRVLLGVLLALTAVLILSCNKNQFNFDDTAIEASGEWKLPIGSMSISLGEVIDQFGANQFLEEDENGNLLLRFGFKKDKLVEGKQFLSLGTLNFHSTSTFANPFPGVSLPEPIDTVFRFEQHMLLTSDSARLETVKVRSGSMAVNFITNLGNISQIDMWSPDISFPNGDTLNEHFTEIQHEVDLAGATFRMIDPITGEQDSTCVLCYAIHYQLTGVNDPSYEVKTLIALNSLKIEEMSGYIDAFQYNFEFDTAFSLPIGNVNGQMTLVGADVQIKERNTFENLNASLFLDVAEFYGNGVSPLPVFGEYPTVIPIAPSLTYTPAYHEPLNLTVSTQHDAIRISGWLDFNPNSLSTLLHVHDTSSLGLLVDALLPMRFNTPNVIYLDTIPINVSEISNSEIVEKIILGMIFDSEMPFNFKAQFYTYNSRYGVVTDSILSERLEVKGSFDGTPVKSEASVPITRSCISNLLKSDSLILELIVDTDGNNVMLNRKNRMGVTLKADVIYDGSIE